MRLTSFRWNEWNLENVIKHGVSVSEAERVALHNQPRKVGNGKWRSVGRGTGDRFVEVIFVVGENDPKTAYIIRAMPPTTRRRRG